MDSDFIIQLITRLDPTRAAEDLRQIERQLSAKSGGIKIKTVIDTAASKQEMQNYAFQIQKLLGDVGVHIDVGKILSALNQVSLEADKTASKVNNIQNALSNGTYDSKIATLEAQFKKLGLSQDEVATKMKAVKAAYAALSAGGLGQDDLILKEKQFNNELTTTSNQLKILKAEMSEYVSSTKQINLSNRIQKWLDINTRATKAARQELGMYLKELQSGQVTNARFTEMNNNFNTLDTKMRSMGKLGKSFFDTLSSGMKKFSFWTSSTFLIMKGIQEIRKAVTFAKELDSALTNINYTMDVTKSELEQIGSNALSMSKDLNTSAENVLGAVKLYANAKESAESIIQKAEPAVMLANVSGFTGEQSAKYLQTIMNQFDLTQDDLTDISDTIQAVSQNLAHDFADGIVQINEGIETSGEVARAAGLDLSEYSSMIGLLVEQTGLAGSRIGNSLKTIITRTTKASKVVDIDEGEVSDAEKALKNVGVAVRETDGEFRDFDDTMKELASVWDSLTDVEKANVSFALAGTRQINVLQSLLRNWTEYEDLVSKANDSSGVTFENQEKYAKSLEGRMGELSATMASVRNNLFNEGNLTPIINVLIKFAEVIDVVTDKLGLLGTIGLGVGLRNLRKSGIFATWLTDLRMVQQSINSLQGTRAIVDGGTLLLKSESVNALSTSIQGLNLQQAQLALSTKNLTKEQMEQVLVQAGLMASNEQIQAELIQRTLAEAGLSAEIQGTILSKLGLIDANTGEVIATEACTRAELANALATEGVSVADANAIITSLGLADANNTQAISWKLLGTSIKGTMAALAANPYTWLIAALGSIAIISYKCAKAQDELNQTVQSLGKELGQSSSDIEGYKKRIDELSAKINDNSLSVEEVSQARTELMAVQDELIEKFGTEQKTIESVTAAINGQTDALDELNQQAYYDAKSKIDEWGFNDHFENFRNNFVGFFDNLSYYADGVLGGILNGSIFNPVAFKEYLDSIVGYNAMGTEIPDHSREIHSKMTLGWNDLDYRNGLKTTGNADLDNLIATAYGLTIDGDHFSGLSGTLEEIRDKLNGIQQLSSGLQVSSSFTESFTKIKNDVDETIEQYKDFDRQYTLYESILSSYGQEKQYDQLLGSIKEAKSVFDEAQISGDTDKIKEASDAYAEIVNNAMDLAINNNDWDVAQYFKMLYPELQNIVGEWKFTVDFAPNVDGLQDEVVWALDKLDGKYDTKISLSPEETLNFNPWTGTDVQKQAYGELLKVANKYGMSLESLVSLLQSLGVYTRGLKSELESELKSLEQGGTVNLLVRPQIDASVLNAKGWNAGDGVATVFSSTFSNEDGTVAINFTPIIADPETGEYIGVLSPKELQTYAEGVINGTRKDNLNLQIGGTFTGEDAIKRAEDAAIRIHELHEQYFADDKTKVEEQDTKTSFKEAWKSLDNPGDDKELKNTKKDLLELAKVGQLTENTFKKVDGAKEWAESINEPIDSVIRAINSYITSSDQLSAMSEGISALTENLYNKTENEEVTFIDADTLAKMPDALKQCKKEWAEYEQVMGDSNSTAEEAQRVTNALATAFINNGNYLSNITEENKGYYISQMESVGITNAKAIADQAAADNAVMLANTEDALTVATEAASGEISESTSKLLDYSNMSDTAKASLMDLSAKQTIFSNQGLDVSSKVDALNRLAQAYFGVGAAITYAGAMGTDSRFVKGGKSVEEQWNDFVKKRKDKPKIDTTGINPDKTPTKTPNGGNGNTSKLFDYIEIRLERLDRLRSKYLKKAEDGTKSLTARTLNYGKALSATNRQISFQGRAIKRYDKELKKIGLDKKTAKKLREGALSTENLKGKKKTKAEKYLELYEKKLSAIDDRDDLISERNEIKRDRIQLKIDNRENKRKHLDTLTEQLKSDFDLTSTKGNYNAINNVVSKQITNYQKQNKLIKEQQSLVKKGSEEWYKYQDSIDSNNESIQDLRQSMIDLVADGLDKALDKLENADELSDAKMQNVISASAKNKYVDEKIGNISARKTAYDNAITGSLNAIATNKSAVLNSKVAKKDNEVFNSIKNYVNNNQLIPEEVLAMITNDELLRTCITYNSAISAYETNKAAKDLYEQTSKEDLRNLIQEKATNISDSSEAKLDKIDARSKKTEAEIKEKEALGVGQTKSLYTTQISQSKERQKELQNEKKSLEELLSDALKKGQIVEGDPVFNSITNTINGIDNNISDCVVDQIKFNKSITDMNLNNYKSLLDLLDKINDKFGRFRDLFDVHDHAVDDEVIFGEIENNNKVIEANKQIIDDRVKNMRKALLNSIENYGWGMNLTDKQADAVLDFLLHGQSDKIQDYLTKLLGVDINKETFPGLFETIDEIDDALDGIYKSYVEQEKLFNEYFDKRIDGINDYLDKLEKEKNIKDRTYAIEKAQFDLEKARNNLTKKVWDGTQWVYAADTDAIRSAQEAFDDAQYDELVNVAEDLIEVLEYIRDNLNFYDDYGNQLLPTNAKAIAELLQANGISETDTFLKSKGIDVGAMDFVKFLKNPSIPIKVDIPELTTPNFADSYANNSLSIDKVELILPNITDASTARDLAEGLINQLSNLPGYVKQYNWNR